MMFMTRVRSVMCSPSIGHALEVPAVVSNVEVAVAKVPELSIEVEGLCLLIPRWGKPCDEKGCMRGVCC